MRQKTSQLLFNYWNDVRNGRLAPQRFEIEPAKIAPLLPETFIAECSAPPNCHFRLAGTRLCEQFGRELRGQSLTRHWVATDRQAVESLLSSVITDGGVGVLEFEAMSSDGRDARFEMLVLPLIHVGRSINRLLGSVSAIRPPLWLGSTQLVHQQLRAIDLVWPDGQPSFLIEQAPTPAIVEEGPRLGVEARRRFRVLDGGLADRPK